MRTPPALFLLLSLGVLGVLAALQPTKNPFPNAAIVRKHSFKGPFLQAGAGLSKEWAMGGSTVLTDSFVRVTPAIKDRKGWIWNNEPVTLRNWMVEMQFKVGGGRPPGADGFAFWYAQTPQVLGPVYGSMDQWLGLGVMFDTYDNDRKGNNPYVLAMLNDGTITYDHDNDGLTNQLGGCIARYRNLNNVAKCRIIYNKNTLEVQLDLSGREDYETCVKANNIHLPTGFYFGVSAATGGLSDNHDVYSLQVYDLDLQSEDDIPDYTRRAQRDEPAQHRQPDQPSFERSAAPQPPSFDHQPAADTRGDAISFQERLNRLRDTMQQRTQGDMNRNARFDLHERQPHPSNDGGSATSHQDIVALGEAISVMFNSLSKQMDHVATDSDVKTLAQYLRDLYSSGASPGGSGVGVEELREELMRTRDYLGNRIVATGRDIIARLDELNHQLINVGGSIESTNSEQQQLRQSIQSSQQNLAKDLKKSSRWGFWTIFFLFQFVLLCVYVFWKKNRDEQNRKLP
eukprot:gnl/Trimastix_PCT/732.p1 GENE.gnl/Trimastix_PCT/732~~gnl/Trimastix_PCT/732.p1  ORF type:complete len:514 (+),score=176.58 gnl/Trimastix_PCT/732:37-1578(+)